MSIRPLALLGLAATITACAGGAPSLEYRVPTPADVRYSYADTTAVSVAVMGQNLEMNQQASAEYAVGFAPASSGVEVTMTVAALNGQISQPMGAPIRFSESDVEGALVFSLDREGNAVVQQMPEVDLNASQVVSGLGLAHGFFPGLPGRSASAGESWVDTVSFEGTEGAGRRSDNGVMRYTVRGDTTVAGRALLVIDVEGTGDSYAEVDVGGMTVTQRSETRSEGHILWDPAAGLMVERYMLTTGEGTATAPIAPTPLPIRVRARQHVKLQGS